MTHHENKQTHLFKYSRAFKRHAENHVPDVNNPPKNANFAVLRPSRCCLFFHESEFKSIPAGLADVLPVQVNWRPKKQTGGAPTRKRRTKPPKNDSSSQTPSRKLEHMRTTTWANKLAKCFWRVIRDRKVVGLIFPATNAGQNLHNDLRPPSGCDSRNV